MTKKQLLDFIFNWKGDFKIGNFSYDSECPIEVLEAMGRSKSSDARMSAAKCPRTPIKTLIKLSKDKCYWVREQVALNPSAPVEALDRISRDNDDDVRWRVAGNPNCPIRALLELAMDYEPRIRNRARKAIVTKRNRERATPEELLMIDDFKTLNKLGLID